MKVICLNIKQSTYEAMYKPETVKKIVHIVEETDMVKLTGEQCIAFFNTFCVDQLVVETEETTAREQLYKLLDEHRGFFEVDRPTPRKIVPRKSRITTKEYIKKLITEYGTGREHRAKILKKIKKKYPKSQTTRNGISQVVSEMRKRGEITD